MSLWATAFLFSMLSGFRHAFEPDHLAAVSTLVAERQDARGAARLGMWWGFGHTLALAGVALLLALVDAAFPPGVEEVFEFGVAVMLLVLGARAVRLSLAADGSQHAHHGFGLHRHTGTPAHVHVGTRTLTLRPLVIGLIHGLAGSGALVALVMSALPTPTLRLVYTVLFGVASTAGMALVSGLTGWSLARITPSPKALAWLSRATGTLSIAAGVLWGYPILATWLARF